MELLTLCLAGSAAAWLFGQYKLKRHWADEVHRLHRARQNNEGPFNGVVNDDHQLGRVYGYLYAATRNVRWLSISRFSHVRNLIQEVLFQPDVIGHLQRCVAEQNSEFYRGWEEGQLCHAHWPR